MGYEKSVSYVAGTQSFSIKLNANGMVSISVVSGSTGVTIHLTGAEAAIAAQALGL